MGTSLVQYEEVTQVTSEVQEESGSERVEELSKPNDFQPATPLHNEGATRREGDDVANRH